MIKENKINYNGNYYDRIGEILKFITYIDLQGCYSISRGNVEYISNYNDMIGSKHIFSYVFDIKDVLGGIKKYTAIIQMDHENNIYGVSCNCRKFMENNSCKHIGACFATHSNVLFDINSKVDTIDYSLDLLDKYNEPTNIKIKKEVFVELKIVINEDRYYEDIYELKIYIGTDKKYLLNKQSKKFFEAYYDGEGVCNFGQKFIYDSQAHYFSEKNAQLLENLYSMNNNFKYEKHEVRNLFNILKNFSFTYGNYYIDHIIEEFPLKSVITEETNYYNVNFNVVDFKVIDDDCSYIFNNGKIYHLNNKAKSLLKDIINYRQSSIAIPKEKLSVFTVGILPLIKKNTVLDENVKDIVLTNETKAELYFDLNGNNISCNIKLIYDDISFNYFENNTNIIRDINYENNVLNDLVYYDFVIENNKILLEDIEKIVFFLEEGINELTNKYPIFTSEKLKKVNIRKKTSLSSTFGIGSDNILNYTFDLGGIENDELVNIFKNIKKNKKYYKLKNGDILNLEDDSLKQLEELSEDLEFTDEDIINGKGKILKYRAIYLDSIKDSKYNIIKTDNLFNNFINKFYQYKDSNISLTEDDEKLLRPYQKEGIKWLYNIYKTGFGGILADEMGLGKTIQTIYYIKEILREASDSKILIVVPTSLAYNWENEFNMFGKDIKKCIVVGNKVNRLELLNNMDNYNVLVTTYGVLREDFDYYRDKKFHTVIIDEAQNIKNNFAGITRCVKEINADTKFALTGTPIENSITELWSIFDFIMPGYLSSIQKFQSKYKIRDFDNDTNTLIQGLNKQIKPFILRRRKEEVVKELPPKLENDIYIDLSDDAKRLYVAELERVKREMDEVISTGGMSKARFIILQLLTKLRQICIDPSIIYENYEGGSNKIDTLINVINEYTSNNHKILIFSSFRTGLNIVRERLDDNDIKCYMIDGSVSSKNRMEMVTDFNNNSNVKVFLIMLKSGGTGLNLTGADVVIHLDLWWNPQAENQATDRTHRIGQTKVVEVIHLITKGTIEEKILELQKKKRTLSDKIIDGDIRDKNILSELTEKDIKNLLSYENSD